MTASKEDVDRLKRLVGNRLPSDTNRIIDAIFALNGTLEDIEKNTKETHNEVFAIRKLLENQMRKKK
jgi:hypothetical protein